ncbi:hypothetical protein, partial [Trichococcus sp.]|uniref:hypothetical protein n=1 Tax=Trichococcus sp. TaxID=1985464 RepID=UPI003C7A4E42
MFIKNGDKNKITIGICARKLICRHFRYGNMDGVRNIVDVKIFVFLDDGISDHQKVRDGREQ